MENHSIALLLAAGKGTRLKPMTDHIPKCLMPINGRPLLDIWIQQLVDNGFKKIFINTSYKSEVVQEFLKNHPQSDKITILKENYLLGTAGTIGQFASYFSNSNLFVAYADNLSIFPLFDLMRAHDTRPNDCMITMMTFSTPTPRSCGIVEINDQKKVIAFHEKIEDPPGNLANAAVFLLHASVVEKIKNDWTAFKQALMSNNMDQKEFDLSRHIIPQYIGKILSWHNDAYHRDIGTQESYLTSLDETRHLINTKNFPGFDAWLKTIDKFNLNVKFNESLKTFSGANSKQ